MISKEEIKQVSDLCMLDFTDDEIDELRNEMTKILDHINVISEVDADGIEPTYFVNDRVQKLREDLVVESMDKEEVLKNAPQEQYGYFKLINVMED